MLKSTRSIAGLLAGTVALVGGSAPARARVDVGIGIGVPLYPGPYYGYPSYYPYSYYYNYPPPIVYTPPPVIYTPPAVAAPSPLQPAPQSWYYCDNPKGYYPYVASCATGWRQVPATPPADK